MAAVFAWIASVLASVALLSEAISSRQAYESASIIAWVASIFFSISIICSIFVW
jgi:hypothetical protein